MNDIRVTRQKGGAIEFDKTGIYPEYLRFYAPSLKISWRVKLVTDPQKGTLRVKCKKAFEYEFFENTCKLRKIENGLPTSSWFEMEKIMFEMRD